MLLHSSDALLSRCCLPLLLSAQWLYLMIQVLPYSAWELPLPDYFLLGYALRVCMWLTYTATIVRASGNIGSVDWMMLHPVLNSYDELQDLDAQDLEKAAGSAEQQRNSAGVGALAQSLQPPVTPDKLSQTAAPRKQKRDTASASLSSSTAGSESSSSSSGDDDDDGAERQHERRKGGSGGSAPGSGSLAEAEMTKARLDGQTVLLIKPPSLPLPKVSSAAAGGRPAPAAELQQQQQTQTDAASTGKKGK